MAQTTTAAAAPQPSPVQEFWEWLTRRSAIKQAEQAWLTVTPQRARCLQRAEDTLAVAKLIVKPGYPLPHGSEKSIAFELLCDALHWGLRAVDSESAETALAEIPKAQLFGEDIAPEQGQALLERMLGEPARHSGFLNPEGVESDLALAQLLVERVLLVAGHAHSGLAQLRAQRWKRSFATLLMFVGGLTLITLLTIRLVRGPDLAYGKPWQASSVYPGFNLQGHICDGIMTEIFFHTNEENEPWVQIDLERVENVSRVVVKNREQTFEARAIPLALELSKDGVEWVSVRVAKEPLARFNFRFATQPARYVRLKALNRTWLHLERIQVYR